MENQIYQYNKPEKPFTLREINLLDYWLIIIKRKWMIAAVTLIVVILAGVYTFTRTPIYTARGTLLIEKEANILSFEQIFQVDTIQPEYYQTQYRILQSRSLADRTIERLKLYDNPDFVGIPISGESRPDPNNPNYRGWMVSKFLGNLTVSPIKQTRLVEVSFSYPSAKLAADAVNALFVSFIALNIEIKSSATEQAAEFLTQQIAGLKADIDHKERQMQDYGAEKNIVALSDKETTIVDKLTSLNKALTDAQIDRVNKESNYNGIKSASPEFIPEALSNPLIQRLREDYINRSRDYAKKENLFTAEYPELQRMKADLTNSKQLLENETNNLIKAAYADYQAALKKEASLLAVFNTQKREAYQLNSNSIAFNTLKSEINNNKLLLDTLVKRQSETGVSSRLNGIKTSNIRVVDQAETPSGASPSSSRKRMNMILGLMVGLMGGMGLAFLLDYLDNSVKSTEDVEKYAELPALGIVPAFDPDRFKKGYGYGYGYGARKSKTKILKNADGLKPKGGGAAGNAEFTAETEDLPVIKTIDLITQHSPKSNFSENYRAIRTAILLSSADGGSKAFVLTSPLPAEGKTVTISNLAVIMAQAGKKVLLIDADLRKPRQHRIFKMKNINGLTNYLTDRVEFKDLIKSTDIQNLYVINAGPVPPNPAELLGSPKMAEIILKLKQVFDIVLFDTPPILPLTDALVLGQYVDGLILVIWGGKTSREALKRAKEKMDLSRVKQVGVIINRIDMKEYDYHYKLHYYHYESEE